MSNLPVVPGAPSSAEIDAMKRAMQAVHGNLPTVHEHQAHYSGGSQGRRANINETYSPPPSAGYYSGGSSAEDVQQMKNLLERLEQINGKTSLTGEPIETASGYEAISILGTNKVSVVAAGTRNVAVADLALAESAMAIAKLLNRGEALESIKVQQVLDLDEEYAQAKSKAATIKENYARAVQLNESESATVFKKRHAAVRANALAIQEELKALLAAIR